MSKTIARQNMNMLRLEIEKAVNQALEKIDPQLKASMGRITYLPGTEFRGKLVVTSKAGMVKTIQKINGDMLKVGDRVTIRGRVYTFEGRNPAGRKFAFLARRDDGKLFKLTSATLLSAPRV